MTQQPQQRLDTTRLQKMAQAYWESAALMAAVELEIFTAIAHGHDTIPAVAKAIGISERNAKRDEDRHVADKPRDSMTAPAMFAQVLYAASSGGCDPKTAHVSRLARPDYQAAEASCHR